MRIRRLEAGDLERMSQLQRAVYLPALAEPPETFANKMALFPEGALGCVEGEALLGYTLALPWRGDAVVPLHGIIDALPERPDALYLHDMVVDPDFRGRGIARQLLSALEALAARADFARLALVAVQGAEPFWQHLGFTPVESFFYAPGCPATRMVKTRAPPSR